MWVELGLFSFPSNPFSRVMPRLAPELKALQISRITRPGVHAVGGVPGLCLQVIGGSRSWLLRASIASRRVELGLGPYPEVGVAAARIAAAELRRLIRDGIDPREERRRRKAALQAEERKRVSFAWCAEKYIATQRHRWKNEKHGEQWVSTLTTYAYPVFGSRPVGEIDRALVLSVLRDLWFTKTETASRLRGRIERILDWATANELRSGDNPAAYALLQSDLPPRRDIAPVTHHRALPYAELPEFYARLREVRGGAARCLRLLILCAVRSSDALFASWDEFDLQAGTWRIGERIKAGVPLLVPLSDEALGVLREQVGQHERWVFPGAKPDAPLSNMAMTEVLRGLGADCVVHGFRTTFRTWAAEQTNYPREVCEFALAHKLKDKVEAAYNRSNLLDKRRPLMADWARFCIGGA